MEAKKAGSAPQGAFKPKLSVEHSRNRVQCRTGQKGPGQNHSVPFGEGTDYTKESALVEGQRWLDSTCK